MNGNILHLCEPFPLLTTNGLWKEYYKAANFSICRIADIFSTVLSGARKYLSCSRLRSPICFEERFRILLIPQTIKKERLKVA